MSDSHKEKVSEDLRDWFGKGGEGGVGGGGWDRYDSKGKRIGKCARENPNEPKPKCLSKEKASKLRSQGGAKAIAAAVKRKRTADPIADRSGKGGKPVMVSNKIKEENEEVRYCTKCKKRETRNECSYGPEVWDKMTVQNFAKEAKDHEYSMARSELSSVMSSAKRLKKKISTGEGEIEAWVQSKITKAADYLSSAADYVDSGEMHKENITIEDAFGNIFAEITDIIGPNQIEPVVDEACWRGYKQVGMKKKGKKMVPNCVPEEKNLVSKILEEIEGEEILQSFEEENKPTNPSLWSKMKSKAKSKFDVYPSAYANAWAAKEYKKAGGGWKSVKEEFEEGICPYCGCDPCECEESQNWENNEDLEESVRIPSKNGHLMMVVVAWRGKNYALKMFFPTIRIPSKKDIESEIQKIYPESKVVYSKVSEVEPGQPFIQVSEDWQKVNRQDKTDGLSSAAVKAYRRENPGSKLQTAVTEKNPEGKRAKRRSSFCSRMKGMKSKLTSAKTSRDPDSRINKALRRWNCN
jgi:hypothetical protein